MATNITKVITGLSKIRRWFKARNLATVLVVVTVVFLSAGVAHGSFSSVIATIVGWVVYGIVMALGQILILLMRVLVSIAEFNNFINAQPIVLGWTIVRDVCNMFFVVIMLVIAFATVLRIENYSYKKLLPKLVIMAILINFSKMICGLIIDASQVVMLTFVNSFKDVAGANLTSLLGLDELFSMNGSSKDVSGWSVLGAYILALIYVIVALMVVVTMAIMLAVRIVMIWIYVVLSPVAYLLGAFPAGQKYAGQWWSEFTKNILVGPILAFFIWLSFASLGSSQPVSSDNLATSTLGVAASTTDGDVNITKAGSPDHMLGFLISIAMLYGGLQIAQQIGGAAGGIAGKGMNAINKGQAMTTKALGSFSKKAAMGTARTTGRLAKAGFGGLDRMAGAGMDKIIRKVSKDGNIKTSLAEKGLFATTAGVVVNAPRNLFNQVKEKVNGDRDMKSKLRDFNRDYDKKGDAAVLEHNDGKKYKWDKDKNQFYNVDNPGEILKNKKGKDIEKMSSTEASWRDAWRSGFGKSSSASNKEQEADISKIQKEMADSGTSNSEMLSRLENKSTSATEKMAIAMTLAIKGGFKDHDQVLAAKKAVGNNSFLSKNFNDEMDKNQAHLNYNLKLDEHGNYENQADAEKFKKRVDQGKIDTTKMQASAYKDEGTLKAIEEYHGDDFNRVMESAYRRGKKYEEAVSEGLTKSISADSKGVIDAKDKFAGLNARLTGNVEKSFKVGDNPLDKEAFGKTLSKGKPQELNKMKLEELQPLIAADPGIADMIIQKINLSKLKGMARQGNNDDLVKFIANLHVKNGSPITESIENDNELKDFLDNPPASTTSKKGKKGKKNKTTNNQNNNQGGNPGANQGTNQNTNQGGNPGGNPGGTTTI